MVRNNPLRVVKKGLEDRLGKVKEVAKDIVGEVKYGLHKAITSEKFVKAVGMGAGFLGTMAVAKEFMQPVDAAVIEQVNITVDAEKATPSYSVFDSSGNPIPLILPPTQIGKDKSQDNFYVASVNFKDKKVAVLPADKSKIKVNGFAVGTESALSNLNNTLVNKLGRYGIKDISKLIPSGYYAMSLAVTVPKSEKNVPDYLNQVIKVTQPQADSVVLEIPSSVGYILLAKEEKSPSRLELLKATYKIPGAAQKETKTFELDLSKARNIFNQLKAYKIYKTNKLEINGTVSNPSASASAQEVAEVYVINPKQRIDIGGAQLQANKYNVLIMLKDTSDQTALDSVYEFAQQLALSVAGNINKLGNTYQIDVDVKNGFIKISSTSYIGTATINNGEINLRLYDGLSFPQKETDINPLGLLFLTVVENGNNNTDTMTLLEYIRKGINQRVVNTK